MNTNWPVVEVVAEYARLPSAAKSLMVARSTGFPAESRRTPLQEDAAEQWREANRTSPLARKKARANGRSQQSIARHYTRVDFDHDSRWGGGAERAVTAEWA